MPLERLQKILARAGVASRRAAEKLIRGGRVRVNGKVVTELGTRADPRRDKIEVDQRRIQAEDLVYLVLHKPRGFVSTVDDPEGRPTVLDLVADVPARVYPVGRLDFSTSGVLLLTNDGELTQGLLHPRRKVPKIYVVKLDGVIADDELERWRGGIVLEDGFRTQPTEVQRLRDEDGKSWLRVVLHEGKNLQIRRMAAASGFTVMRLARVSFAGIDHEDLRPGMWRPLTVDELRKLKKTYGVPTRVRPQPALYELWAKQRDKKGPRRPRGDGERAGAMSAERPAPKRSSEGPAPKRSADERPARKRTEQPAPGRATPKSGPTRSPKRPERRSDRAGSGGAKRTGDGPPRGARKAPRKAPRGKSGG